MHAILLALAYETSMYLTLIFFCMPSAQETVSSTEDISIKTRSVIELKKLQLLHLQRQLRRCAQNSSLKPRKYCMDRIIVEFNHLGDIIYYLG